MNLNEIHDEIMTRSSGNACCYSAENLLLLCPFSKMLKISKKYFTSCFVYAYNIVSCIEGKNMN